MGTVGGLHRGFGGRGAVAGIAGAPVGRCAGGDVLLVRGYHIPYNMLAVATVPGWLVVLGMSRAYDIGPFGTDPTEMRRVVSAAAHFLALIAVAYYVVHLQQLGREFLIAIIPLATAFTLTGRFAAR